MTTNRSRDEVTAGRHVLVVEDNPVNRHVIQSMLKQQGIRYETVENGAEAVERVASGPTPNLILMDCQMPVMDGFEATRRIRRWERETGRARIPIIAVTAGAFDDDGKRALAAEMDDLLTKPIDLRQLKSLCAQWMREGDDTAPLKRPLGAT